MSADGEERLFNSAGLLSTRIDLEELKRAKVTISELTSKLKDLEVSVIRHGTNIAFIDSFRLNTSNDYVRKRNGTNS